MENQKIQQKQIDYLLPVDNKVTKSFSGIFFGLLFSLVISLPLVFFLLVFIYEKNPDLSVSLRRALFFGGLILLTVIIFLLRYFSKRFSKFFLGFVYCFAISLLPALVISVLSGRKNPDPSPSSVAILFFTILVVSTIVLLLLRHFFKNFGIISAFVILFFIFSYAPVLHSLARSKCVHNGGEYKTNSVPRMGGGRYGFITYDYNAERICLISKDNYQKMKQKSIFDNSGVKLEILE